MYKGKLLKEIFKTSFHLVLNYSLLKDVFRISYINSHTRLA